MDEQDQKSTQEGFSLAEILIAIAILAVVSLGIMALLPSGYKQITNAGRSATLNHLGQKKLDWLKSVPITHWDLFDGTHPTVTFPEWPLGVDAKYSITWEVVDYTPLPKSKSVIVEVGYDIYTSGGASKPSDQALEQKRVLFPTIITQ
jgi:prepilin-type N-terminal cleavage/methylation domain-containing protein